MISWSNFFFFHTFKVFPKVNTLDLSLVISIVSKTIKIVFVAVSLALAPTCQLKWSWFESQLGTRLLLHLDVFQTRLLCCIDCWGLNKVKSISKTWLFIASSISTSLPAIFIVVRLTRPNFHPRVQLDLATLLSRTRLSPRSWRVLRTTNIL